MQSITLSSRGAEARGAEPAPTVLIVDDDSSILQSLARILRKDFDVLTAASAANALTVLETNAIGVVVVDMSMPGMNGLDLLEAMRPVYPSIVPVMLTRRLDPQTPTDAINKGHVFRFLSKPCQSDEIKAAIVDA